MRCDRARESRAYSILFPFGNGGRYAAIWLSLRIPGSSSPSTAGRSAARSIGGPVDHRHSTQLQTARSRLYRRRFWQSNSHFAAFFKIYKICTLLHRSELEFLDKSRHFFEKFSKKLGKSGKFLKICFKRERYWPDHTTTPRSLTATPDSSVFFYCYVRSSQHFRARSFPPVLGGSKLHMISQNHASQAVAGTQVVNGNRLPLPRPGYYVLL